MSVQTSPFPVKWVCNSLPSEISHVDSTYKKTSRCSQCKFWAKVLTYFVETLALVAGLENAAVGVFGDFHIRRLHTFHPLDFEITLLYIIFGSLAAFLATVSFAATWRKNTRVLLMCSVLGSGLFVTFAGLAVWTFYLAETTRRFTWDHMVHTFMEYSFDPRVADDINHIQITGSCCGVFSYADWRDVPTVRHYVTVGTSGAGDFFSGHMTEAGLSDVPASCCRGSVPCSVNVTSMPEDVIRNEISVEGCYSVINKKFSFVFTSLGGSALVASMLLFVFVLVAHLQYKRVVLEQIKEREMQHQRMKVRKIYDEI